MTSNVLSCSSHHRYLYQALKKDHPTRLKLSDLLSRSEQDELHLLEQEANFHKELEAKVKLTGML